MTITLARIAHARSGDKGPHSNVGILFRSPEVYNWAVGVLTPERIKAHFSRIALGESLGGGGSMSLKNDAQGKTHGQALLRMEVDFPDELAHCLLD